MAKRPETFRFSFLVQTTILDRPNYVSRYFEELGYLGTRRQAMQVDFNQHYLEKRELLILQMSLVKYKIEHGEFPETLDAIEIWTTPKVAFYDSFMQANHFTSRYFYFANGLPDIVVSRSWHDKQAIPENTPFVSNRNPVPYADQASEGIAGITNAGHIWNAGYILPYRTGHRMSSYEPPPMVVLLSNDPVQGGNPE